MGYNHEEKCAWHSDNVILNENGVPDSVLVLDYSDNKEKKYKLHETNKGVFFNFQGKRIYVLDS